MIETWLERRFPALRARLIEKNGHRSTEAYIMGLPKAGNTWLRVMLGRYVQSMSRQDPELPPPLFAGFDWLGRCTRYAKKVPRIQVTHGPLDWNSQKGSDMSVDDFVVPFRDKLVVLLVRNIPDMLVSHFWQFKTQVSPPYLGDISKFIRDEVLGAEKVLGFFRVWDEGRKTVPRLMLLRYEDLRREPTTYFRNMLDFLGIPVIESYLADAVSFASFENMRRMEMDNLENRKLVYSSSGLPIFATGDIGKSGEAFHVRKGKIGGFREYLSEADQQFLRNLFDGRMPEWYGYGDGLGEACMDIQGRDNQQ
jgi:hypothetical protein